MEEKHLEHYTRPAGNSNVDRIEGHTIFLKAQGYFPKKVVIVDQLKNREYLLRKTPKGGYILV